MCRGFWVGGVRIYTDIVPEQDLCEHKEFALGQNTGREENSKNSESVFINATKPFLQMKRDGRKLIGCRLALIGWECRACDG